LTETDESKKSSTIPNMAKGVVDLYTSLLLEFHHYLLCKY
ncbi:36829_t:CDS:1, partial [Racocetra persica]